MPTLAKKRKYRAGCILAVFSHMSVTSRVIRGLGKSLECREIAQLRCLWPRVCVQMGPNFSKLTSLCGARCMEKCRGRASVTAEPGTG